MNPHDKDAVSSVVGTMLMLTVTLIIASVAAAYVGGTIGGGVEDSPVASLFVYADGSGDDFCLIFEHRGGDLIRTNDLEIVTYVRGEDNDVYSSRHNRYSERSGLVTPQLRLPYVYEAQSADQDLEFGTALWRSGTSAGTDNREATADFLGIDPAEFNQLIEESAAADIEIVHAPSGRVIYTGTVLLSE